MTVAVDLVEAAPATSTPPTRRPRGAATSSSPRRPGGRFPEAAYLAGNSLGLQPRTVRTILDEELRTWAELGVEGHVEGERPWKPYHAFLREPLARAGRRAAGRDRRDELAHGQPAPDDDQLLPAHAERHAIVIEDSAFPSDSYAVRSQAALHGFDPDDRGDPAAPARGEDTPAHRGRGSRRWTTGSRSSCSAGSTT